MSTDYTNVLAFHRLFNHPVGHLPSAPPESEIALRVSLVTEEFNELMAAIAANDIVEIADAMADLKYVINGTALAYGIDLPAVDVEVQRSNLSKGAGGVVRREDGKILKSPHYFPPDIINVLINQRPLSEIYPEPTIVNPIDGEPVDPL